APLGGRRPLVGRRARPVRGGPLDPPRADRRLPHAGRDHGGGGRRAGRARPGAHHPAGRAQQRRGPVGAARGTGRAGGDRARGGPGSVAVIAAGPFAGAPGATVLTPREARGLEFDSVLLVEPQRMEPADLYVALTRATQRLGALHSEPLPGSLRRLAPRPVTDRPAAPPPARAGRGTHR